MPVHPTFPGVYIEEIPSGVRPVAGVATSIAAFVGSFQRGLRDEAVQLFGMADFEREYGGIDRYSETSYAIQQFFLNGGTQAWVVRLADTVTGATDTPPTNARPATIMLTSDPGGGTDILLLTAGRQIRGESAENPGSWGNALRAEVSYETADPATQFNLTISEVRVDGDRTLVLQSETFRNLTMEPDVINNAIEVINQGSRLVQASLGSTLPAPFDPVFRPASTGTLGDVLPIPASIPPDGAVFSVDIGGGAIAGTIDYGGATPPTTYAGLLPFIQAAIRRAADDGTVPNAQKPILSGATVKLIGNSTVNNDARFAVQLGRNGRPFDPATRIILTGAGADAVNLSAGQGALENDQQIPLADGHDGQPPAAGTNFRPIPLSVFQGSAIDRTGINALEDIDLFNILCVPEATYLDADEARTLYSFAETYVEGRRAMLIVDIPDTVRRLDQMQTWLTENESLRHPNAVVYFPRTNIVDTLNGNRPRLMASSGTIAGLWARTDAQRGVWKAPAGTDARLRNVDSLGYLLTDLENGTLNPLGVNCLRNFPVYSNICWGARTLDGADAIASDWKYVPVRRTTLFIEESLYRGTKWVVFEPNDEPLWSQIRLNVGAFMHELFRQGAFQGTTPAQAYFVRCDSGTTPQSDIDLGIVNIEIGFAPLKPAEFVILKIQQIVRQTVE
ncbi:MULTISPECIES: phage tail sheath C-terminal domain-containing protein [unclassified Nitrobacter]|uniref:phage tail sheath C-terminal domain-containing protein n=1 Tax=unclassified Nitrobacter TaxID=2620411 RepID=UPI0003239E14|nr:MULTISPECIES: phage tail sheath C-terminal domain-containing protein [unclassified Nitrobacter]MCB1391618.1 phage tail protein [Nitrobacter sp.]MCV0386914.1 phage tail protein [Nitrobacter sp.]